MSFILRLLFWFFKCIYFNLETNIVVFWTEILSSVQTLRKVYSKVQKQSTQNGEIYRI